MTEETNLGSCVALPQSGEPRADLNDILALAEKIEKRTEELHAQIAKLVRERNILRGALIKIAAFDDGMANDALGARGSYALFDEPGSVAIARDALTQAADAVSQAARRETNDQAT